jgi:hypothetical protein
MFSVFNALDLLEGLGVGASNYRFVVLLRCIIDCLELALAIFNAYKNAVITVKGARVRLRIVRNPTCCSSKCQSLLLYVCTLVLTIVHLRSLF